MVELKEHFDKEFFIIDSDNLDCVKQRLYGYSLKDYEIIQNENIDESISLDGFGAYIYVDVDENHIRISQDFNGCYGIYVFRNGDYFAISNSFVKLVDYLKFRHEISLNKDYADAFLFINLSSFAYCDTLVNEINVIPRNFTITIDKKNKTLDFEEIDYEEKSVPIDTKEGLEILDAWYYKWVNIIRDIKQKSNNLSIDLSGGFDSRIIATLWITANIDFNKIKIKSHTDEKHVHKEDFEIASKIAEYFNFNLNEGVIDADNYRFKEIITPLNNSFYLKLGFHKQMYFKTFKASKPIFSITGEGGGSMRGYPNQPPQEYLKDLENIIKKCDANLVEPSKRVAIKAWDRLSERFNIDKNSNEITEIHYKETRGRNHFGKASVESYFSNMFTLTPLIDSDLRKLKLDSANCGDNYLLFALIFSRYCPDLLNFEFEGEREIDQKTLDYAFMLNEKYPFVKKELSYISGPEAIEKDADESEDESVTRDDINNYLRDIFFSNSFEMEFKKYYTDHDYNYIISKMENRDFFPLGNVYSAMSIVKVAEACQYSQVKSTDDEYQWLENFRSGIEKQRVDRQLVKYYTARIDIKNNGEGNLVDVIEKSDANANVTHPKWFKSESGEGCVVKSDSKNLNLKIKCVNDGKLDIKLRGPDVKDRFNKRFPVYIDYTGFKLNGEDIITDNTLVSHDEFYLHSRNVKDGEIINLEFSWLPFNDNSIYQKDEIKENNNQQKSKSILRSFRNKFH